MACGMWEGEGDLAARGEAVQKRRRGAGEGEKRRAQGARPAKPKSAGRPRQSEEMEDARTKICEVALDLFAERNFSAVTIKDISDASGLNAALIYYYFGSKEELFRATLVLAVERAFQRFRLSRPEGASPREVIDHWLDTHVREMATISKLLKLAIDYASTAKRRARIDEAIRRFYDDERVVLREALSEGVKRREFRPMNVEETATFISTFLDGVMVRWVILEDFEPARAIEDLRRFLTRQLKA